MSTHVQEPHWFAFQVKPRYEAIATMLLQEKGYEGFSPTCKKPRRRGNQTVQVEAPLFPEYVFCRCRWEASRRSSGEAPILTTPGILRIVGYGKTPEAIEDVEIEAIRRLAASDVAAQPWPYVRAGERTRVLTGPLKGTEGVVICEKGVSRLILSITLLQRSVAIEFDRWNVAPAGQLTNSLVISGAVPKGPGI